MISENLELDAQKYSANPRWQLAHCTRTAWPTVPQCSGNTFLALSQIYSDLSRYKALILWQQQQTAATTTAATSLRFRGVANRSAAFVLAKNPL